jgi:hypothetical protein
MHVLVKNVKVTVNEIFLYLYFSLKSPMPVWGLSRSGVGDDHPSRAEPTMKWAT